ncbi:hypothetical protein J1605_010038 [Eschrichtius robustus]|uniref:Uncharacterized protein n=1 Tax=Eschrichtius robustus TaxID=9764 RepID=A0AB34GSS6_ESCRO|nr:hypothetical protein J1605_010038 [Eschrichtius robustus]
MSTITAGAMGNGFTLQPLALSPRRSVDPRALSSSHSWSSRTGSLRHPGQAGDGQPGPSREAAPWGGEGGRHGEPPMVESVTSVGGMGAVATRILMARIRPSSATNRLGPRRLVTGPRCPYSPSATCVT